MPTTKIMQAMRAGQKGNFAASRNTLLSLFDDPDEDGERSWRETFGYERRLKEIRRGRPFIARELRKSSSGS